MSKIPNPGSEAARAAGCTCPVLDNAHGKGYMGQPGVFVYVEGCPVHVFGPEFAEEGPYVVGTMLASLADENGIEAMKAEKEAKT